MSETYNGWANVETWRVQLHLANDEQTAVYVADMVDTCRVLEDPAATLAILLIELVESNAIPAADHGLGNWEQFASDTVQAALSRVDWRQLAERWLESTPSPELPA